MKGRIIIQASPQLAASFISRQPSHVVKGDQQNSFLLFCIAANDANGTTLHSLRCKKAGRYWVYSGHWPVLARFGYDAIDPEQTK